jgi:hypothetical protein
VLNGPLPAALPGNQQDLRVPAATARHIPDPSTAAGDLGDNPRHSPEKFDLDPERIRGDLGFVYDALQDSDQTRRRAYCDAAEQLPRQQHPCGESGESVNASRYIGRVGGLAVALGVGAALFTGNGIAWAGPDSQDSSVSSASGSQDSGASGSESAKTPRGPIGRTKTSTPSEPSESTAAPTSPGVGDEGGSRTGRKTLADILGAHRRAFTPTPPSASQPRGSASTTPQPTRNRLSSRLTDARPSGSSATRTTSGSGALNDVVVNTRSTLTSLLTPGVVAPPIANTPSTLPALSLVTHSPLTSTAMLTPQSVTTNATAPAHDAANVLVTVVNQILRPSAGTTPTAPPPVDQPATLILLAALRRGLSGAAATLDQPNAMPVSPTLVLDGYNLVPTSPEHVISFYGIFTKPPATPGVIQGTQEFDVVDPDTGDKVGTIEALVSNTNSFILGGSTFQELYVTKAVPTEGADPGDTPPEGTLISTIQFGKFGRFGTAYTSTPSASGNVVSFKLVTPLRDFRIPVPYDGALVFTAVNTPLQINDEYYIAPAPGSPETITSITGVPPFYAAAQGEQVFNVYQKSDDGNDVVIGSFKGYVTTTSDALGATTEAILVTEVLDGPVGTGTGDVPPVGSVYNVIYRFGAFYSAIPSPDGTVITFTLKGIRIPIKYDATATPAVESLEVPGKYTFVPTSTLQPIGINGLPPREVQIQGYQQFDVYDANGVKVGSFDADVTTQWGSFGTYTEAILVTNVTDGTQGTGPGDVPPVGSQFNYLHLYGFNSPVGAFYSAVPSSSGDVTTFKLMTPFLDIPIPAGYNAIKGLGGVSYFDPF